MKDSETLFDETPEKTVTGRTDHDCGASVSTQGTTDRISAGINKVELQEIAKTNISGEQQRKLWKADKIAAGTWSKEEPHRGKKGPPKGQGNRKACEGTKRPRDESKTPPQASKKPRSSGKLTGTYSEVASKLRMAVIDRRHPEITLDQGHWNLIQERLIDAVDETPTGSNHPLQFERTAI